MTAVYLDERIEDAQRYVAHLEATYAGLRDGTVGWREWDEDLTCSGRQQVAAEECATALDAARAELEALEGTAATARQGVGE